MTPKDGGPSADLFGPSKTAVRYRPPECGCEEGQAECTYAKWPPGVKVIRDKERDTMFVLTRYADGFHTIEHFFKEGVQAIREALAE